MISELIRLADNWPSGPLTGQETHRRRAVHWFVDLDGQGDLLGFSPTVGAEDKASKRFLLPVNYRLGSPNQFNWLPDFLSGPVNEIFNYGVDGTSPAPQKRRLLWRLIFDAYQANRQNRTIQGIWCYLRSRPKFSDLPLPPMGPEERKRLLKDLDQGAQTLSFRVNGRVAVADPELKAWWVTRAQRQRADIVDQLRSGEDAFLPGAGPLTDSFPTVFGKYPACVLRQSALLKLRTGASNRYVSA